MVDRVIADGIFPNPVRQMFMTNSGDDSLIVKIMNK